MRSRAICCKISVLLRKEFVSPVKLHWVKDPTLLRGYKEGVQDYPGVLPLISIPQALQHELRFDLETEVLVIGKSPSAVFVHAHGRWQL